MAAPRSGSPPEKEQLLKNVKRFRGGLVFKANRLLYHSALGLRVGKKKKNKIITCEREKSLINL
jgi:hypothetical protein